MPRKKTPTPPPPTEPPTAATPLELDPKVAPCPKCDGAGEVKDAEDYTVTTECDLCAGTGEVPTFLDYRLPNGVIVQIHFDLARREPTVSYTMEGGEVVDAVLVEPQVDPVNPVQAAAELAAAEPPAAAEPAPSPAPPPPAPDHIPDFLAKLRDEVIRAELAYDDAAEEAKGTKKSWEEVRERFERAFDGEIRKNSREPGLPFDGVHMSDTPQPAPPAAAAPEKEPGTVHEFPRAVPDAPYSDSDEPGFIAPAPDPPEPSAADIANDPADPDAPATPQAPPDDDDPTVH